MCRHVLFALAVVSFASFGASTAVAQKAAKKAAAAQENAQMLSLEVIALQTLRNLDLTATQVQELLRLSKTTTTPLKPAGSSRVTPAFVKTLTALRQALLANDEDRINDLRSKLDDIMEKENIQLDDRVPISSAARRHTAQAVRLLKPSQVLSLLEVLDVEEIEPAELIQETLEKGKKMDAPQWKVLRDLTASEAAWLIAGSDEGKSAPMVKRITALLDQHHNAAGAKNSKSSPPDLEKQLQSLTGHLEPFEILRHAMEREMAELLSNPCLPQALQHTLEQKRKLAAK